MDNTGGKKSPPPKNRNPPIGKVITTMITCNSCMATGKNDISAVAPYGSRQSCTTCDKRTQLKADGGQFTGVPERDGAEANSLVVSEPSLDLHRAKVVRAPGSRDGVGVRAPAGPRCNPMNQCAKKQPKPVCTKGPL